MSGMKNYFFDEPEIEVFMAREVAHVEACMKACEGINPKVIPAVIGNVNLYKAGKISASAAMGYISSLLAKAEGK